MQDETVFRKDNWNDISQGTKDDTLIVEVAQHRAYFFVTGLSKARAWR